MRNAAQDRQVWIFGVSRVEKGDFAEDEEAAASAFDAALMFTIRAEPGGGGHGLLVSNWTVESAPKRW